MKRKVLIILLSILVLCACKKLFEPDNPYDKNTPADLWAPASVYYNVDTVNSNCIIEWSNQVEHIEGFKIDKYSNDEWEIEYAILGYDEREWIDTNFSTNDETPIIYRIYAYALNNISASLEISITAVSGGVLIDRRDGNFYTIAKIGNQTWMAENLNYYTRRDSWCYDNNTSNCNLHGRLYNWETAKTVCPLGWKLPSKIDFETLLSNVGDSNAYMTLIPSGNSGFSALFGGWRTSNGTFYDVGGYGYFWSSSPDGSGSAWGLSICSNDQNAYLRFSTRSVGFSVRCLQE